MNFTQSFEEFSAGLQPIDLALYAGVGVILWVLFKDGIAELLQPLLCRSGIVFPVETDDGNFTATRDL